MDRHPLRRRRPPYWVVHRLLLSIAEGYEAWDGHLSLQGVDLHSWTLRRLLNAAEAAMYAAAENDAERARIHAKLYAPPAGSARRGARRPGSARPGSSPPAVEASSPSSPSTGDGMAMGHAQALMAQLAAEDARLARGGNG